jgi:hypothetical protein
MIHTKIMIGFKKFIENKNPFSGFNKPFPGAVQTSSDTGSQAVSTFGYSGRPNHLPDLDLAINDGDFGIPEVVKEKMVTVLNDKKKIIEIELEDGTKLYFSPGQYRSIQGDLPIIPNKTKLKVAFQRHGKDISSDSSNITRIEASYCGPQYLRNAYKIKNVSFKPVQL